MNAQSLGNKHLQILDYFINCKIDIHIITEIWINDECPMLISDLNSQSYGFILFTRTCRGGGIGVMYNKNIKNPIMEKQEYSTFELLTVKLCVSGKISPYMKCIMCHSLSKINTLTNNSL